MDFEIRFVTWLDWTLKGGMVESESKSGSEDVLRGGDATVGSVGGGSVDGRRR